MANPWQISISIKNTGIQTNLSKYGNTRIPTSYFHSINDPPTPESRSEGTFGAAGAQTFPVWSRGVVSRLVQIIFKSPRAQGQNLGQQNYMFYIIDWCCGSVTKAFFLLQKIIQVPHRSTRSPGEKLLTIYPHDVRNQNCAKNRWTALDFSNLLHYFCCNCNRRWHCLKYGGRTNRTGRTPIHY